MKPSLQVLHIEDSLEDSELVKRLLEANGIACDFTRVETRNDVFDELQKGTYDIILSDCTLPHFSGRLALEMSRALRPEIPFVFVSGTIGEETAIESLRNGATDYVLKQRLSKLAPAVRRALDEAEERTLCHQMQQRLREAGRLEAISTLSQGIAHDFNNVLTIILGHASLLTVECDRPERVRELTSTITEAARRASDVVQQLLAFAHRGEGRGAPTNVNRWVEGALGLLKEKLPPHIEISFQPAPDLPMIWADGGQLERMLLNLIDNSIESMPEGGKITLSTEIVSAADQPTLLSEIPSGRYICLKVADTGMGMDSRTRQHLFEPFFTTKERRRGTGLGLPVVYGLMQAQNGYIHVESEPGQGTEISLFFPVPKPHPTQAPSVAASVEPSLSGSETLLVVEDETDVCYFLEAVLKKHGYQVLIAHDYNEALSHFEAHRDRIRLVFSDIGLPGVDGITLCSKLRELKPDLQVILASGYSPVEFKDRLEEFGRDVFLSKPYQMRDILLHVRKVLDSTPAQA